MNLSSIIFQLIISLTLTHSIYSSDFKTVRININDSINSTHLVDFNTFSDSLINQIFKNKIPCYSTFILDEQLDIETVKCRMEYLTGTSSSQATLCADFKNCHVIEFCEYDRDSIDSDYFKKSQTNLEMYPFNFFKVLDVQFKNTDNDIKIEKITFYLPDYDHNNIVGIEYPILSVDFKDIMSNDVLNSLAFVVNLNKNNIHGTTVRQNDKPDNTLYYYDKVKKIFIGK